MTNRAGAPADGERHAAVLGRLTRGALHEIANPLLALVGSAELALEDAEAGTKVRSRLEVVHSMGSEIAQIVRALQAYARERDEPPRRLSLADAAEQAITLVRRVSAVRDVELELRRVSEPAVIVAPGALKPRLVELLLDGLAEAARGDVVRLSISSEGAEAVAQVSGVGELRLPLAEGDA
jgi:signal transduction histidine kinase